MKIGVLALVFMLLGSFSGPDFNDTLNEAYAEYVKGEKSSSVDERKRAFNQSLKLYLDLEARYQPAFGSGRLYYNIAGCFFQLEELPFAALYYYRAQALMPRDRTVEHNLQVTLEKLGVAQSKKPSVIEKIFFFHHLLSLPERLQAFFFAACISLLFGSFFIWKPYLQLKKGAILFATVAFIFLFSIGYNHFLSPISAVIVRSTSLYRDAGLQYARVREEPVLSGSKVEVLDVSAEGNWLKVMTEDGSIGYTPQESIRMI